MWYSIPIFHFQNLVFPRQPWAFIHITLEVLVTFKVIEAVCHLSMDSFPQSKLLLYGEAGEL